MNYQSGCFSPQTFHLGSSWLFILSVVLVLELRRHDNVVDVLELMRQVTRCVYSYCSRIEHGAIIISVSENERAT